MSSTKVVLAIPADHVAFAGHFPGEPVLPGVVLLHELLHAIEQQTMPRHGQWRIVRAKFHNLVKPGETVVLDYVESGGSGFTFTLRVDEHLVASGTLSLVA